MQATRAKNSISVARISLKHCRRHRLVEAVSKCRARERESCGCTLISAGIVKTVSCWFRAARKSINSPITQISPLFLTEWPVKNNRKGSQLVIQNSFRRDQVKKWAPPLNECQFDSRIVETLPGAAATSFAFNTSKNKGKGKGNRASRWKAAWMSNQLHLLYTLNIL